MLLVRDDAGLADLFPGSAVARRAIRWEVFYWSGGQWSLLSVDLSCADREGKECAVFCYCGGCGRGRVSALFAVPAGVFAGDAGVDGDFEFRVAGFAVDRGEWA